MFDIYHQQIQRSDYRLTVVAVTTETAKLWITFVSSVWRANAKLTEGW